MMNICRGSVIKMERNYVNWSTLSSMGLGELALVLMILPSDSTSPGIVEILLRNGKITRVFANNFVGPGPNMSVVC